ncbi:MAG: hypothetical protein MI755_14410, partial [Sphingomonadales bacterium]|nr:hypothetical protein [Sphingomonadales bacterium]
PTPDRRVSRITTMAALDGKVFAGLRARKEDGPKLLQQTTDGFEPVPGWPDGRAVSPLIAWRGYIYAVTVGDDGVETLRTDGRTVEPIDGIAGEMVHDLAAGPDALWLVTGEDGAGALWRSTDGRDFRIVHRFEDALPIDVLIHGGAPYVGTIGPGEQGALWGPETAPDAEQSDTVATAFPSALRSSLDGSDLTAMLEALDGAIAEIAEPFDRFGDALGRLIATGQPSAGRALSERVKGGLPEGKMHMFGGTIEIRRDDFVRWHLIAAIAAIGHGHIPPELIARPFHSEPNRAEKYLDAAVATAWAVGRLGQKDEATLAALIDRLGRTEDPPWLNGDLIGALTALTGQRFGHDIAAWRAWWA